MNNEIIIYQIDKLTKVEVKVEKVEILKLSVNISIMR